jgi:hypothetical protein
LLYMNVGEMASFYIPRVIESRTLNIEHPTSYVEIASLRDSIKSNLSQSRKEIRVHGLTRIHADNALFFISAADNLAPDPCSSALIRVRKAVLNS